MARNPFNWDKRYYPKRIRDKAAKAEEPKVEDVVDSDPPVDPNAEVGKTEKVEAAKGEQTDENSQANVGDAGAQEPPKEGTEKTEEPETKPWADASRHADVDAAVPEGTELPDDWSDLTIADKKSWLDANANA